LSRCSGRTGPAKSTTLKAVSGLLPTEHGEVTDGQILFDGQEAQFSDIRASEALGIVIIHQELALVPQLSITENIFLGNEQAERGVVNWGAAHAKARDLLKTVGLDDSTDTPVRRLGVGKQQLVEIAKALSKKVTLLNGLCVHFDADLAKVLSRDPSTFDASGTRNEFLRALNGRLDLTITRFNALRSDPQLAEQRNALAERADRTSFGDGKSVFACPDPQLQTALHGVVRAIDSLPSIEKPNIAAVEGSEADRRGVQEADRHHRWRAAAEAAVLARGTPRAPAPSRAAGREP